MPKTIKSKLKKQKMREMLEKFFVRSRLISLVYTEGIKYIIVIKQSLENHDKDLNSQLIKQTKMFNEYVKCIPYP